MTAGRKSVSRKKDWCTPPKYVEAIRSFFGGVIHLDPCSNPYSLVHARVEYQLPSLDGLEESWDFPSIYVNPPYGIDQERGTSIRDWLARCEEANRLFRAEVIALVPVATNTGHWKRFVYGRATAVCFLYDTRLRFLENGFHDSKGAPMSCALIYWGERYDSFFQAFIKFGAVVSFENLKGIDIGDTIEASRRFVGHKTAVRKFQIVRH
jgi:hypothetical protein